MKRTRGKGRADEREKEEKRERKKKKEKKREKKNRGEKFDFPRNFCEALGRVATHEAWI